MADFTQAQARQAAINAGNSPAEVDAFIANQGGARTSAQRIMSAFNVAGVAGTNDLTVFHAEKATPFGQNASETGHYLSGLVAASDPAFASPYAVPTPLQPTNGGDILPAASDGSILGHSNTHMPAPTGPLSLVQSSPTEGIAPTAAGVVVSSVPSWAYVLIGLVAVYLVMRKG